MQNHCKQSMSSLCNEAEMQGRNKTYTLDGIKAVKLKPLLCCATEVLLTNSIYTGNSSSRFLSLIPQTELFPYHPCRRRTEKKAALLGHFSKLIISTVISPDGCADELQR